MYQKRQVGLFRSRPDRRNEANLSMGFDVNPRNSDMDRSKPILSRVHRIHSCEAILPPLPPPTYCRLFEVKNAGFVREIHLVISHFGQNELRIYLKSAVEVAVFGAFASLNRRLLAGNFY